MALGRPRVPKSKKHQNGSISLPPGEWVWVDRMAAQQGVPRSQVFFDGLQTLRGDIQTTLGNLRQELADQQAITDRLQELASSQQEELKRLQASQDLVGAIVSPYGTKPATGGLDKMEQEKARTVRALLGDSEGTQISRRILELRAEGDNSHQLLDIHRDGLKVWGSPQAYWGAVQSALKTKKVSP